MYLDKLLNIPDRKQPTILLVDDHDLVRAGIRLLIQDFDKTSTIVEASTGEESIEIVKAGNVDIVFMDIMLPGIDGVTAALRLLQLDSKLKIIMLTGRNESPVPRALVPAGVCGYMTKSSATEDIKSAIDAARQGQFYLSPDLIGHLDVESWNSDGDNPFDRLSQRELQVVLLLLQGYKTSDTGDLLVLNAKTVSTYKRRAFEKLEVENTAELIKLAITFGILGLN